MFVVRVVYVSFEFVFISAARSAKQTSVSHVTLYTL